MNVQVVEISAFGNPDVLAVTDRSDLCPPAGAVRIAIEAISVGYQDVMARNGSLAPYGVKPGHIPGGEVAGIVDAVGEGIDTAWLGRPVWALIGLGGGYASQAVVPADEIVPLPEGLSPVDAVALGTAGVVAHFALDHAGFRPGQAILVRGAAGPLGIMAVQLAALRHAGAVAVTASSNARGERLRSLGATRVLDRAGTMDGDEVDGFDVIIDVVAGPDIAAFIKKLRPGGRMVMVGAVGGPPGDVTATMFANFQQSLGFSTFSANLVPAAARRAVTADLFDRAVRAEVRTAVAETIPLQRAADAHRLMEAGGAFGRIVLVP